MTLQSFLKNEQTLFDNQTLRCLFCIKLTIYKISSRISNAMFDILQEILQSYPFLKSGNFKTQGCQWYGAKRIKSGFADKENSGTRFIGHIYIASSSSHFFSKTDLKHYLLKKAFKSKKFCSVFFQKVLADLKTNFTKFELSTTSVC